VTEKLNGLWPQRAGAAIQELAVHFHSNRAESVGYLHETDQSTRFDDVRSSGLERPLRERLSTSEYDPNGYPSTAKAASFVFWHKLHIPFMWS
jgi:hypothetical protein